MVQAIDLRDCRKCLVSIGPEMKLDEDEKLRLRRIIAADLGLEEKDIKIYTSSLIAKIGFDAKEDNG